MKTKTLILACLLSGIGLTRISAQQAPYVDKWDQYLGFYIPCTNEWVEGIVTLHSVLLFTPDWIPVFIHRNPIKGELVCQATGNVYKLVGGTVESQRSYFNGGGGGAGLIIVQNLHLIGKDVNFIAHFTWTTVMNGKGDWVHDYFIENVQCN